MPVEITGQDSARVVVMSYRAVQALDIHHHVQVSRVVRQAHTTTVITVHAQRVVIVVVRYTAVGDVSGFVLLTAVHPVRKGVIMDSRRLKTRELTVRNVQKVMEPYSEDHLHTLQQVLAFFGIAPKLERILWATLKKEYERRKRHSEEMTYGGTYEEVDPTERLERQEKIEEERHAAILKAAKENPSPKKPKKPRGNPVAEPPELTTVVDVCTCGRTMVGTVVPTCSKVKHQPIFYKECTGCTRYVETYRTIKRNRTTYYRSEGG